MLKDLDPDERNNVKVYAAANKGVVNITTEAEGFGFFGDETSTGYRLRIRDRQAGTRSDQFSRDPGCDFASALRSSTARQHSAKRVGADPSTDVAVLLINVPPEKLFPLTFGDSSTSWSVRRFWPSAIRLVSNER